jgi:hypothetical protein
VSKKNCWILSDNLVGHEKQSISLAEKLNINYKLIKIKKINFIKRNLSSFFNLEKKSFFKPPYPKIIISCGKSTAYYSKMIKQKAKNKIFSIFIQKPPINLSNFDVVISPKHDKCKGLNVIETQGALTKINSKYIKNINKKKAPSILKKKFVTVLIGGDSKHHKITKSILDKIIKSLRLIEEQKKIRIFILVSRRTGKKNYLYLKKNLVNKNFIFILPNSKKVSYLNAISFAKAIIVTSDSVSMVTEASSTGKPTYIIDIPTKSKKFSLFIKNLIDLKLAYYLKDTISLKRKEKALNDIDKVAKKIKKKIKV